MGREVYTKKYFKVMSEESGQTNWVKKGEKISKDIKIYIKPEENKAYYVINGDITGSVWI